MNETILQFNYPASVIHEYDSWIVLMRPQQVTVSQWQDFVQDREENKLWEMW